MKLWIVLTSIFASVAAARGAEKMSNEEAEVMRLEQSFLTSWNKADARGAAAVYAEDGMRVGAFGDVAKGRPEVQAAYEKLFHGPMKGATIEWQSAVRLIAPDLAIAQGPLTIHPTGGGAPMRGYALDLWKKIGGKWQVIEGHPKLFPPRP